MKDISLIKNTFANFVTLEVDLEKLNFTSDNNQHKAYNSETPRKNNVFCDDIPYFKSCLTESIKVLMSSYNQKYKYEYHILDPWEHEYIENDYQEDHVHFDTHFSFIIYLKGDSKTVFKNPIGYTLQAMYINFDNVLAEYDYEPNLKEGTMIVFPSFVPHYVKKQSNAKTVSGDILIKRL